MTNEKKGCLYRQSFLHIKSLARFNKLLTLHYMQDMLYYTCRKELEPKGRR
uniref:Uncharacterized protein n=1 Tax=Myoviridae sp. ctqfO1 TaxID=2827710 RepID=A0A8S5T2W6_9CAUD|nr:MAG TPA: hypothetical protein [Myoviridae sp. ctqfO1]